MGMTNAERMRQLMNELEAEMSGDTLPVSQVVLPDGKKILSETKKIDDILATQHSKRLRLAEVRPADVRTYQTTWRGTRAEYDPEFFDVGPDELRDETGQLVASKDRLQPRPQLRQDLPTTANPNLVYRGMSNAEYRAILQTGEIKSRGDYNFDVQKGLTYFSTDPRSAVSYAHSFAPWQHKANWDNPAWVIAVPRPDPSRVRRVRGTGEHEVGIEGSIPASEIKEVYRGRVVEYRPGDPGKESPSAWLHWEQVPVPVTHITEADYPNVSHALDLDIVEENFEDGKGPGRSGDSQRHGIPRNATMAQLQKAAKSKGRRRAERSSK